VSTITIGTAPDSWGVWFPSDPEQLPAEQFVREVAEAGYEWIELGPYGYLPTDPGELSDQLDQYGLQVLAGTVFSHLHQPDAWDYTWKQVTDVAALTQAVGGEHIVVIPDTYRDQKTGAVLESSDLTDEQWKQKTEGLTSWAGGSLDEYGLHVQFHSHADSHIGYQPDIERLLESTDPEWVNLVFDTGHIAYYGGDCLELIEKYPIASAISTSSRSTRRSLQQVLDKDLSFPRPCGWAP
jgi:inosose dehydratase